MPAYRIGQSMLPGDLAIFPKDVAAFIGKVDAEIHTLDMTVQSCPNMPGDVAAEWAAFLKEWAAFDKDVSLIPLLYLQQYHSAVEYEDRARRWEPVIKDACGGLKGPSIQPSKSGLAMNLEFGLGGVAIGAAIAIGVLVLLRR